MTIRYQRAPGTLRIERVEVLDVVQELTALEAQAADVRAATLDVRRRAHRLKLGLLADHRRRVAAAGGGALRVPDHTAAKGPPCSGVQVRLARALVGLSQREVSALLALSRGVVADTETGRRQAPGRLARWATGVLRAKGEPNA
jgi:DNA-binding transcriptional regulator YiaG